MEELKTILAAVPFLTWKPRDVDTGVALVGYDPLDPDNPLVFVGKSNYKTVVVVDDTQWSTHNSDPSICELVTQIADAVGIDGLTSMYKLRELVGRSERPEIAAPGGVAGGAVPEPVDE